MSAPDTASLVAWTVELDDDGHCEVIFAPTAETAWDRADVDGATFDADHVTRAPHFDGHSPGPVPMEAFRAAGWWWECTRCGAPDCEWKAVGTDILCETCQTKEPSQ